MRRCAQESNKSMRARVVCAECHSRKVRCDLEHSSRGKCSNCRRHNQECSLHVGARKKTRDSSRAHGISKSVAPVTPSNYANAALPSSSTPSHERRPDDQRWPAAAKHECCSPAYIGDGSLLSWPRDSPSMPQEPDETSSTAVGIILQATKANLTPAAPLLQASADFYFEHLYSAFPIVDREHIVSPSLLMKQTLHFAGSLVRQADSSRKRVLHETYEKIRTLLFLDVEPDKLVVLKALCMLSCWSPNSPDVVTLDSSWHWAGSAMRLAMQIGLHRECTYQNGAEAGCRRRLWWCLFNTETVQGASYGRPTMCLTKDVDVKLPTLADFEVPDLSAKVFIATAKLCLIVSDIQMLSLRRQPIEADEVSGILKSLKEWLYGLPPELQLYEKEARRPYNLATLNIHLLYLAAIIWCSLMPGRHRLSQSLSVSSFVASSCIARFYEEILCHEDVHRLLPHHGWISTVAAVPPIYYIAKFPSHMSTSIEELDILTSVVSQLATKYASAHMVLRKITAFRNNSGNLPTMVSTGDSQDLASNTLYLPGLEDSFKWTNQLLPFPEDLCSSMVLLKMSTEDTIDLGGMRVPFFGVEEVDYTTNWNMVSFDDYDTLFNALNQSFPPANMPS